MERTPPPGEITVHHALNLERTAAFVHGTFTDLFDAYREHAHRWELPLDDLVYTMMREGLASLVLHLTHRPPDESMGVTLNVKIPALNLFLTGDSSASTVAGRAFTDGVQTEDTSRMFVQSFRPRTGAAQSTIEVSGLDVLGMFEDYYLQSEQNRGRFFDLGDDRYAAVIALPDVEPEGLGDLDRDAARALVDGEVRPLGTRSFRFWCGCTLERILEVLRNMFGETPEELFQGEAEVETYCPRCGARWWIKREEFGADDA